MVLTLGFVYAHLVREFDHLEICVRGLIRVEDRYKYVELTKSAWDIYQEMQIRGGHILAMIWNGPINCKNI